MIERDFWFTGEDKELIGAHSARDPLDLYSLWSQCADPRVGPRSINGDFEVTLNQTSWIQPCSEFWGHFSGSNEKSLAAIGMPRPTPRQGLLSHIRNHAVSWRRVASWLGRLKSVTGYSFTNSTADILLPTRPVNRGKSSLSPIF
jgi:hypothetical protein